MMWIVTDDLEGDKLFDNYEEAKQEYDRVKLKTHEHLYLAEVKEWSEMN